MAPPMVAADVGDLRARALDGQHPPVLGATAGPANWLLPQELAGGLAIMGGVQVAGALIRQHPAELIARRRGHAGRFRLTGHILDHLVHFAAIMGA